MANDIKRVVSTKFWEDEKIINMFTPEDKLFYLYLFTNPHTTQLGIYTLIPKQASFELGYSIESIMSLLDRFEHRYEVIKYSKETCEVAIHNYLFYAIIKGGKPVMDCLLKEERDVINRSLLWYILDGLERKYRLLPCKMNTTVLEYMNHLKEERTKEENHKAIAITEEYINDNDNDNERYGDESWYESWDESSTDHPDNSMYPVPNDKVKKKDIDEFFEAIWRVYPKKKGKGSVSDAKKKKLYEEVGLEQMLRCIDRYKDYIRGKDEQYVMYGSTFFNSGYVDYLDANCEDHSYEEDNLPFK